MIGRKFTCLTVIDGPLYSARDICWMCKCECGNIKITTQHKLTSSHVKSCGCLQKRLARERLTTHGKSHEPEYSAWVNMRRRCSDARYAKWYGGITVCDRWRESYDNFLVDVGRKPFATASLDRIDPKKNYTPDNVRWTDAKTQSRNTKNHVTSTTGIRGVSWSKAKNKWRVAIYVDNKQKHLGYFDNIEDAKLARQEAEKRFW